MGKALLVLSLLFGLLVQARGQDTGQIVSLPDPLAAKIEELEAATTAGASQLRAIWAEYQEHLRKEEEALRAAEQAAEEQNQALAVKFDAIAARERQLGEVQEQNYAELDGAIKAVRSEVETLRQVHGAKLKDHEARLIALEGQMKAAQIWMEWRTANPIGGADAQRRVGPWVRSEALKMMEKYMEEHKNSPAGLNITRQETIMPTGFSTLRPIAPRPPKDDTVKALGLSASVETMAKSNKSDLPSDFGPSEAPKQYYQMIWSAIFGLLALGAGAAGTARFFSDSYFEKGSWGRVVVENDRLRWRLACAIGVICAVAAVLAVMYILP